MEKWPDRSLTKFSRGKCKVLHSWWNNLRQQDRLGLTGQQAALQKNSCRFWWITWWTCDSYMLWQQASQSHPCLYHHEYSQQGREGILPLSLKLVRPVWTLCRGWTPQHKRGMDTLEWVRQMRPASQELEHRSWGRGVCSAWRREANGGPCCCLPLPNGRLQRGCSQTLLGHTQAGTWENSTRYEGKKIHHNDSQLLRQGTKGMSRILIFVDIQNSYEQDPEQPALNFSTLSCGWATDLQRSLLTWVILYVYGCFWDPGQIPSLTVSLLRGSIQNYRQRGQNLSWWSSEFLIYYSTTLWNRVHCL